MRSNQTGEKAPIFSSLGARLHDDDDDDDDDDIPPINPRTSSPARASIFSAPLFYFFAALAPVSLCALFVIPQSLHLRDW